MGRRLSNSLELVKASARVLGADRELVVFPLLSGIATILVGISFFVPTLLVGGVPADGSAVGPTTYLGVLSFYIVQFTIIYFFNSALVAAALIRLEGGNPTVLDGLRIAGRRLGAILGYAILSATVGVLLNALSRKAGFLGRLVVGMAGLSWSLATYLVVPVLVARGTGPIDAVRESAALLRRTWGEQVAGTVGMGIAFGAFGIGLMVVSVGIVALIGATLPALVLPVLVLLFGVWIVFALGAAALKGIYSAALYRYADAGEAGWGFERSTLASAFREGRR